jgi:hypothetical protein
MSLRGAGEIIPEESLGAIERTTRVVTTLPFAGGVLVVAVFAISIAFPAVRTETWFALLRCLLPSPQSPSWRIRSGRRCTSL